MMSSRNSTFLVFRWFLINLLYSYFSNQRQYLVFHNAASSLFEIKSRVPQRPNLRALLFMCVSNDLPIVLKDCGYLVFTDVFKIYKEIKDESDCILLQRDLNNITDWSTKNYFQFNISKCYMN